MGYRVFRFVRDLGGFWGLGFRVISALGGSGLRVIGGLEQVLGVLGFRVEGKCF